jgi:hypothetical protein
MILTILVPTNNLEYIDHIVCKFRDWKSKKTQLIIAFNGIQADYYYAKAISLYNIENLIFLNSGDIDLVACLDEIVERIDGEYVTFIGKDDMFMYEMEKLAFHASKLKIMAIKYDLNLVHFWPGTKNSNSLTISIKRHTSNKIVGIDDNLSVVNLFNNAGQDYKRYKLVNFYHGLIRTELLIRAKKISGQYVGGFSPDIYFATSLSIIIDKLYLINMPFSIPGIGKKSASHEVMNNQHTAEIDYSFVNKYKDRNLWPDYKLPLFNSQSTWAATMLIALSNFKMENLTRENFNWGLLNIYQYIYDSNFRRKINAFSLLKFLTPNNIYKIINHLFYRILNRLNTGFKKRIYIRDDKITDLEDKYIRENKSDYDNVYNFLQR